MPIRLADFVAGLSGALDLMSPEVVGHHKRVAAIAANLARRMELPRGERADLYMAALLHDVGGFTLQSRLAALVFEADGVRHAEVGYRLLRINPLLEGTAVIVRHHHTPCSRFAELPEAPRKLLLANVLCLADRVDSLTRSGAASPAAVLGRIRPLAGQMFLPEPLRALEDLVRSDAFRATMAQGGSAAGLSAEPAADPTLFDQRGMSRGQLLRASGAFSQIIDFRSPFTATHSRGVAATAVRLAELAGMDEAARTAMRLAGDLHDLGKLAVPAEILDKPGRLTPQERDVLNRHPGLSGEILSAVPGLERVRDWAAQHHEQPCGRGYPLGLAGDALSFGARLLSVADVFTALREDRPYRAGMTRDATLRILETMAREDQLDPAAVAILRADGPVIDTQRAEAQAQAAEDFRRFTRDLPQDAHG